MLDLQKTIIIIGGFIVFAGLIYGFFWLVKILNRRTAIANIKNGKGVLTTWMYTFEEWKIAAEDRFEIRTRSGDSGRVSFTPRYIYLSNGRKDILWELIGEQKYVKHLTDIYLYKESPMNVIRFQVRTKIIKKNDGRETMDESYDLEEFYVPVPKDHKLETEKVMKFYQDILDKNADAVASVMPYGLGLFK